MRAAYPDIPDEADNDVREDGTACHWLAAEVWEGRKPAIGSLSPNSRRIDEDMYDAVNLYIDTLRSEAWNAGETYVEKSVSCDLIYPGMTGTPDAMTYRPKWLRIVDLKYGFRFVEVWDNLQLIIYALAVGKQFNLLDDCMVELTIVQPRSYHRDGPVRSWTTSLGSLRAFLPMLREKANAAMSAVPAPCTPNPGCIDCSARHACVALQQAAMSALEQSYSSVPLELSPAAVGDELRLLKAAQKRMEARVTGLEMQAENLIRKGAVLPGWSLSATFARERWMDGMESHVVTLGRYYNADLAKPRAPISPAQARKLIPAAAVAMYSHKPSTGVKLTKQDPYEAKKAFQSTN